LPEVLRQYGVSIDEIKKLIRSMKKLLIVFFILSLAVSSCGDKKEDASANKNSENTSGSEGTSGSSGSETKKSEEERTSKEEANTDPSSSENKQNDLGMTPGLPGDFPKDIPTPKNSKTLGSLNSTEGTVVTFESTDLVPDIITFYKDEMKKGGYEIVEGSESLVSDKGGILTWKKSGREVGLMMGYDNDKKITSLVITYK
jgi:flagellar motor protein MotB